MCGIAGYINFDGRDISAHVLAQMTEALRHRGPDDIGLRAFSMQRGCSQGLTSSNRGPVAGCEGGVGFTRLSILDLSAAGHQPMVNAEGDVILAFNGEIYNAFDYRADLETDGYRFTSKTDTEVVLHLYERYGLDGMLERVNGMFAMVIVDLRKREVTVARDHFGIKPMYWIQLGASVLFASEIKAFIAHPSFRPEVDETYVDEYLAFRAVAGEHSLMKGVRQLRPAHCLRIRSSDVSLRRYWTLRDRGDANAPSGASAVEQLAQHLKNSVKSQLLSDVKLGSQLSGGIDSSLVTVFAREHCGADLDTFSVVFDDAAYSEQKWISRAAAAAGVKSHTFTFTSDFFFNHIERATWHLDQPLTHPNSLGIWLLSQEARPFVTVLLSGEGADEVFGGYTRFYYASLHSLVAPWLPFLRRAPGVGDRLNLQFSGEAVDAFICASMFQRIGEVSKIRPGADLEPAMASRRELFSEGRGKHVENCLRYEMQTYLVDLLVRQDKMTMAHSMENRVPFLDRNVVEFARSLPAHMLVGRAPGRRMRNTKVVLKKLAAMHFDDEFVYRPKSGFSLPLREFFADRRFRELMEDGLLPGMAKRGLVDADAVRSRWTASLAGAQGDSEATWIAVALEVWAQTFVNGSRLSVDH